MSRELRAFAILGLLLVMAALGYRVLFMGPAGAALTLVEVQGAVSRIDGLGGARAAKAGEVLGASDRIQAGADGRAVLGFGPESRVSVEANSSIRVTGVDEGGVQLELEEGRVRATVRPGAGRLRVDADGRALSAEDADFTAIRQGANLAVEGERGTVAVSGVPGVGEVKAGERLVAPKDGNPLTAPANDALLFHVVWPDERQTRKDKVQVAGTTEPGATVTLGRPGSEVTVKADGSGKFVAEVELGEGENTIRARAVGAFGNVAEVEVKIVRDTTAPTIGVTLNR